MADPFLPEKITLDDHPDPDNSEGGNVMMSDILNRLPEPIPPPPPDWRKNMANDGGNPLSEPLQESGEWKTNKEEGGPPRSGLFYDPKKVLQYECGCAGAGPDAALMCPIHNKIIVGTVRASTPEPSTAESVLREMVVLLKDQLETKRLWFESALTIEKERVSDLESSYNRLLVDNSVLERRVEDLRVSLSSALLEIIVHEECSDHHHITPVDSYKRWQAVLDGQRECNT